MNKGSILLLLTLTFLFSGCATYTPVEMQPISHVYEVDKSQDQLFVSANNWMAETFVDSKSVIQFRDKEAGVVTGRYLMKELYTVINYRLVPSGEGIFAIIKIQVKDGATKITITPERFDAITGPVNELVRFTEADAARKANILIQSFGVHIKNDSSEVW